MRSNVFLFIIVLLLSVASVSAICTTTFDKQIPTQYAPTEDISAAMTCDNKNEDYYA